MFTKPVRGSGSGSSNLNRYIINQYHTNVLPFFITIIFRVDIADHIGTKTFTGTINHFFILIRPKHRCAPPSPPPKKINFVPPQKLFPPHREKFAHHQKSQNFQTPLQLVWQHYTPRRSPPPLNFWHLPPPRAKCENLSMDLQEGVKYVVVFYSRNPRSLQWMLY